jgi:HAE1 family hydrophobic/amphiphilic exporter-1
MAILVILLFLFDVRSTIISTLALSTSVVATFFLMYALGFALNVMMLLGLSLAIGLLIDDAVVVRENIFKHLERGELPQDAPLNGQRRSRSRCSRRRSLSSPSSCPSRLCRA